MSEASHETKAYKLFKAIGLSMDDMAAGGNAPGVCLVSPDTRRLLRDHIQSKRRTATPGAGSDLILGLRMIQRSGMERPFTVVSMQDAQWEGLV